MVYSIINKFWILPAIVKGVKKNIWDYPGEYPYLEEMWIQEGLLTEKLDLTPEGEETINCIDLLEYELRLVQIQVDEDKPATSPSNYNLLRSGLGQYTEESLIPHWKDLIRSLNFNKKSARVLDYGGGAGRYILSYKQSYPDSVCSLADKANPLLIEDIEYIPLNFRDNPEWYHHWESHFDLILLNEVMHLGDELHNYLLQSSRDMLKSGGYLVVGEQIPNPRFDWRMATMTENGRCISAHELREMARNNGLMDQSTSVIADHHYFMAIKK